MIEFKELIDRIRKIDEEASPKPWTIDSQAYMIFSKYGNSVDAFTEGTRIMDIRGWGSLSKAFGDTKAESIQRANGAAVTKFRADAPLLADIAEMAVEELTNLKKAFDVVSPMLANHVATVLHNINELSKKGK